MRRKEGSSDAGIWQQHQAVTHAGDAQSAKALFLHVGLQDGTLMRSDVDSMSGALSDVRKRYLGTRAPTLLSSAVNGAQAMLALTSRPWLAHLWQVRLCILKHPHRYHA